MTANRLQSLAWVSGLEASLAWIFRGFLHPGIPIVLDHPIHYAEFFYLTDYLIPKTGWISGWCDLHLAGFPMLVTYSIFGYLPGVVLHYGLRLGPEASYKCAVFLAALFAAAMLFLFLSRHVSRGAAGMATLLWVVSPLVMAPCAYGLWLQFWGIGFLLGVWVLCNARGRHRTLILSLLLLLTGISHVYAALALGVFLLIGLAVSGGRAFPGWISVSAAASMALLAGAFYFGPFLESFGWLVPQQRIEPIPFALLGRKVLQSFWSGNAVLIFLGVWGIAAAVWDGWKSRENKFHTVMFLFLLLSLVAGFAPWNYIPSLRNCCVLSNLQVHGTRSLLYAQLSLAYFAALALDRVMVFSRAAGIAVLLVIALGLARPSPFLTMMDLQEGPAIQELRNWIQSHATHRGLMQSTLGNLPGLLGQSHVMALPAFWTGKPQIGGWIGGTLYPQEREFLTESGMLFGKEINRVSSLELLQKFQAYDLTWAVACESRLKQKLESSGFFTKQYTTGPFAIYTLRQIFYNPAEWKADPPAASVEISQSQAGRIDLRITTDQDRSKLVLKHTNHPFWQACLDGNPVALSRDNLVRMLIDIPRAGKHTLSFRFRHPRSSWIGLSAISAAFMAFVALFLRRQRIVAMTILCCTLGIASAPSAQAEQYLYYTVRGGDTMQSISRLYCVSWRTIAQLNRVRRPYRLADGQILKIPKTKFKVVSHPAAPPSSKEVTTEVLPSTFFPDPALVARIKSHLAINAPEMLHWRYIVVHHSATPNGNARGFDEFHRRRRHMAHGLAYHFVIDNGNGGGNGLIEVGPRWKEQWPGGHTANRLMNEIGIGICLVGNFEKSQPTKQQMESLVVLAKLLQDMCNIPDRNVILHRHVAQRGTLCPGRKFPWEKLRKMLLGTQLSPSNAQ